MICDNCFHKDCCADYEMSIEEKLPILDCGDFKQKKTETKYREWVCSCGQEVYATERPAPIRWSDGHTCIFREGGN